MSDSEVKAIECHLDALLAAVADPTDLAVRMPVSELQAMIARNRRDGR